MLEICQESLVEIMVESLVEFMLWLLCEKRCFAQGHTRPLMIMLDCLWFKFMNMDELVSSKSVSLVIMCLGACGKQVEGLNQS